MTLSRGDENESEGNNPPTFSAVADNLFVGQHPEKGAVTRDVADALFLLDKDHQEEGWAGDGVEEVAYPLADEPDRPVHHKQIRLAVKASEDAAERIQRGERVLLTCEMGLNRSPLVAGLTLMRLDKISADDAIARLREARGPAALSNPGFVRILRRFYRGH